MVIKPASPPTARNGLSELQIGFVRSPPVTYHFTYNRTSFMSNIAGTAPVLASSLDSHVRSRLSRWGGLLDLGALTSTNEGVNSARRDIPDIQQMVDTVQLLEASLKDCALHGPQKLVDTFIACQLIKGCYSQPLELACARCLVASRDGSHP